jgi:hypothetical protein
MKLPNWENAVVAERKIVGYLLLLTHPSGRSKAVFFRRFGFSVDEWYVLADALRNHAGAHDVVEIEETPYGMSYTVVGPISTPDGRSPIVRVVWLIPRGTDTPNLVTAYPWR